MTRLLLLGALLWSFASAAHAQAEAEPPPKYVELIESALAESAAGRWQEARALFRRAHDMYPNARTLRGMGMVSFEMREYVETVRHLRAALAEKRRALDPAQRVEAQKTLDQALTFVARYDVSSAPRDVEWSIDGKRVELEADGTLLVPLGDHTIGVIRHSQSGSAAVRVQGGEQEVFPVEFEDPAQPAAVGAAQPAEAGPVNTLDSSTEPSQPAQAQSDGDSFPWTSTIVTATGGAMLIVGTILFLTGMSDVSRVEDAKAETPWSELQSSNDRAPVFTGVGIGLIAAGAVVGTVGVIGLTAGDDDKDGTIDHAGIRVRTWF